MSVLAGSVMREQRPGKAGGRKGEGGDKRVGCGGGTEWSVGRYFTGRVAFQSWGQVHVVCQYLAGLKGLLTSSAVIRGRVSSAVSLLEWP